MGWPGCQYRFKIFRGRSVRIQAISFNWTDYGTGGCCSGECCGGESVAGRLGANRCGAGGFVGNCFVFAAMSWKSRLIICLASTCSCVGQRALYTGIRARSSPCLFSRTRIASLRFISKVIIVSARRFSAAVDRALHIGMSERRCAMR